VEHNLIYTILILDQHGTLFTTVYKNNGAVWETVNKIMLVSLCFVGSTDIKDY